MKFLYSSGQRPLDGYTIKRGIGCGGFGEVYFGVSDSGKEVALKWVRSNHDIEMRGVQQCLNLKHPNLVHLDELLGEFHLLRKREARERREARGEVLHALERRVRVDLTVMMAVPRWRYGWRRSA